MAFRWDHATPREVGSGWPAGPGDRPLLVGRDRELGALRHGLEEAAAGRASLYLVVGEAGIGKTRLADAFATEARAQGARVIWGRCWEAGGAPAYWPWTQVVRACLREVPHPIEDELGNRLRPLTGSVADGDVGAAAPDVARFELFDAVVSLVRQVATGTTLVLILDDLHAADEPSLLLLRYLVGELAETSLVVLAIHREPELDDGDPRSAMLAAFAREPIARRLEPSRLGEPAIEELVGAMVGGVPDSRTVQAIAARTEGNPLFVSEMSRLLAEGRWDDGQLTVPPTVKQVIGRRLDRLDPSHRSTLELAAVVGRDYDQELVVELGIPMTEVLEALEQAEAERIVHRAQGLGRWRFSHVLIRDVLYESLPLVTRKALHDRVGRAIERQHGDDHSQLAHHAMAALPGGDSTRARELSVVSGERAAAAAAHEEAARHFGNALAALALDPSPDEAIRCRLLIELGAAQRRAGQPEARVTLLAAGDIAERMGLHDGLAQAALAYGGTAFWLRAGDDADRIPFLERALAARADREDALRVRLLGHLAGALRGEPDATRRTALSGDAVAIARRLGDPTTLMQALASRQLAIAGLDTLDEMRALGDEMDTLIPETRDREVVAHVALWSRFSWLTLFGPPPEVMQHLVVRADDLIGEVRLRGKAWWMTVVRNVVALAMGRYEGIEAAIERARYPDDPDMARDAEVSYRLARYALARERGEMQEILPMLVDQRDRPLGYWLFEPARIFALASLGRRDARALLERYILETLPGQPRDTQWLWAVMQLADAVALLEDEASAQVLLDLLTPYSALAATAAFEVIAGPVSRAVGCLADLLGRPEAADQAFAEALAMCERTGWRPWEGWTRDDHARSLLRGGGTAAAEAAAVELRCAQQIGEESGMPVLVERCRAISGPHSRASLGEVGGSMGEASMLREGEVWAITYQDRTTRLADSKGLQYLAVLLSTPGRSVPALDLLQLDRAPGDATPVERPLLAGGGRTEADPILDAEARVAYRSRLLELQEEVDGASAANDMERASRARAEMQFLARELAAAVGLGGRPRDHISDAERARQSVSKALKTAVSRITAQDRRLGVHLSHAVRTGVLCTYAPDLRTPLRWVVMMTRDP